MPAQTFYVESNVLTLVYDGECGICREWVDYWRRRTGTAVAYRSWQEAAIDYPSIPAEAFRRAVKLIERDGNVLSGAAASEWACGVLSRRRAPSWNIPHRPRLDWQMWFAALQGPRTAYWFDRFLVRLLQGSPSVLGLLGTNPFPARALANQP